jgi:hypothetical protein
VLLPTAPGADRRTTDVRPTSIGVCAARVGSTNVGLGTAVYESPGVGFARNFLSGGGKTPVNSAKVVAAIAGAPVSDKLGAEILPPISCWTRRTSAAARWRVVIEILGSGVELSGAVGLKRPRKWAIGFDGTPRMQGNSRTQQNSALVVRAELAAGDYRPKMAVTSVWRTYSLSTARSAL